jgi:choline monooxygenase
VSALPTFLGPALIRHLADRELGALYWMERRHYTLECNWKVFVDNYLDGGYHVPHVHRGLDSVLSSREYTIETGERFCLQWSPLVSEGADARTGAVRQGERAFYYWIYPNFMINCYGWSDGYQPGDPTRCGQDGGRLRFLFYRCLRKRTR